MYICHRTHVDTKKFKPSRNSAKHCYSEPGRAKNPAFGPRRNRLPWPRAHGPSRGLSISSGSLNVVPSNVRTFPPRTSSILQHLFTRKLLDLPPIGSLGYSRLIIRAPPPLFPSRIPSFSPLISPHTAHPGLLVWCADRPEGPGTCMHDIRKGELSSSPLSPPCSPPSSPQYSPRPRVRP